MQTYSYEFNRFKTLLPLSLLTLSILIGFQFLVTSASAYVIANTTINQTPAIAPLNSITLNFSIEGNSSDITAANNLTAVTIDFQPISGTTTLVNVSAGTVNTSSSYVILKPNATRLIFNSTAPAGQAPVPSLFSAANQILSFSVNVAAPQSGIYNIFINTTINNTLSDNSTTVSLNVQNGTITNTSGTFSNFTYNGTNRTINISVTLSSPTGGGNNENISLSLYTSNGTNSTQIFQSSNGTCFVALVGCTNTTINLSQFVGGNANTYAFIFNSSGSNNYTSVNFTSILNISKATPTLNTFLAGIPGNQTVTYPTSVAIKGNATYGNATFVPEPTLNIYAINATVSTATAVSLTASGNPSTITATLGNGTYQVTFNATANENFTSSQNNTVYLLVNKGAPTITVYLNATTGNLTVEEGTFFTISANSSSTDNTTYAIQIWTNYTGVNGTVVNTSGQIASSVFNSTNSSNLNIGDISVSANASSTENYTAAQNNSFLYIFVRDTTKPIISSFALTRSSNIYVGDSLNSGAFTCVSSDNNWHTALTTSITGLDTSLPVTKTATCTVTDASGNSASATTQYTVYSGSGFSAPSSSPSTQASVIQTGTTQAYVTGVAAGGVATVSVAQSAKTDVNELDIGFNNQVSNIFVDVTKLSALPSSVSSTPPGTAYSYLTLTVENTQPADINNATVKFQVNKTWIQVNTIDQNRMYLTRYSNGVWTRLSTTMTSEDSNYVYYQAVTPGFSTFAVAGDQVGAPTPTAAVTPTPTPTPAATQTPAVTPSPTTTSQTTYVLIGLAAVLILGALVIYFQRK